GLLRVLNDDIVIGGEGFGEHGHDNMEIISIPISGSLEHRDSTGRSEVIQEGEVQIMSAGTGIRHSEFNHSKSSPVNFLQIWILPKEKNIEPRYEQKKFLIPDDHLVTVVSPEKQGDSIWINQNAYFSIGKLNKKIEYDYTIKFPGNGIYIFVIKGQIECIENILSERDGAGFSGLQNLKITALTKSQILLIEVPMK
ncbi:MAG: pirin family protein, partial [Leptospira sp.]|nr:pirin family protein [Leptospira sp.]